ncbi:hypothetical protein D9M72_426820 [compost metagenome]
MDHQVRSLTAVRLVVGVGIAGVDLQVIIRVGVHLVREERIEALRRLTIAFLYLRAQFAGPGADLIGFQQLEAIGRIGLPDLERAFFLEDAQRDRGLLLYPEFGHLFDHGSGDLVLGFVLDGPEVDRRRRVQRFIGAAGKRGDNGGGGYKVSETHQQRPV